MYATDNETGEQRPITHGLMRDGDASSLVDILNPFTGKGAYGGDSPGDMDQGKRLVVVGLDEFAVLQRDLWTDKAWREITQEQFNDALSALPPARMGNAWFVMGEPLTSDIYGWHVRLGDRYFCANKPLHSSPDAMVAELQLQVDK